MKMESSTGSPVADFYRGRSVFITGSTGFMGKVLVEKLLRSCPDVSALYLLLRPRRGHDVRHRLEDMLNTPIFDEVRRSRPDALRKVVAIPGDMTFPDLGISASDRELLTDEVSVVFHSAATVKFDEALKLSIEMNMLGTQRMLQLAKQMRKLEAFVHVSTAYCNCDRSEVREVVYPTPTDPDKLVQCVEWMDADMADHMTSKILGNRPNTYTLTKAMAETSVAKEVGSLPVAIVRPSIVTAALREPLPGWVDNMNGPTGLFVGAGKGVLRTLYCHRDMVADLIPVDICINLLIAVAWKTATATRNQHGKSSGEEQQVVVYNCVSGAQNPIKWGSLQDMALIHLRRNPYSGVLWYPGGSFKESRAYHDLCSLAFHTIPAYIMDAAARLSGKKPIMVKIQQRLSKAVQCLQFFTTGEWQFSDDNVQALMGEMTPADRKVFDFDVREVDWDAYLNTYVLGIRKFVLKDDPSTFPEARAHLRKMYFVHRLSQFLTVTITWRLLLARSQVARRLWSVLVGILARAVGLVSGVARAVLPSIGSIAAPVSAH
ncbi:putative fatty acyl-CoA reductase CG5065 isoform X1 [Frankliniella occidentalis]|uniref:Fatty acyl-CoA reductase n=1 Tax=Frankliniella occidentalis TaxID=133901 RepID=A0A6J1SVV9_FRAOC|nr:putative fatty acyl-CoA reductase CG5065 isoform X1 [Frankliniella occidentalis]